MIDFFSMQADELISAYGEYCSNHNTALSTIKNYQADDQRFSEWYKYKESNPLLKRKGLNGFTLSVSHRLTKYPILIDAQIKKVGHDDMEREKLVTAKKLIKSILEVVNACVAERNKEDRRLDIFKRIDAKSTVKFKNTEFRKSDIMDMNRRLKFEGQATLVTATPRISKLHEIPVTVVVLTDVLFFLRETPQKYTFFAPDNKAGVVSLHKLLIRENASDARIIYFISTDTNSPEMYELKIQQPKDMTEWIKTIRAAVQECPFEESESDDAIGAEQKQKMLEVKHANIRELIKKMRITDIDQAILLHEKVRLHATYLMESGAHSVHEPDRAQSFLENLGTYKELITDDCDTIEITRRVYHTIQEISQLASSLHKAATGYELPAQAFAAIDDRAHPELFQSPKLPARAETFSAGDERRQHQSKPHQHHHHHHHFHQSTGAANWHENNTIMSTINNTTISLQNKDNHQDKSDSCTWGESDATVSSNNTNSNRDPNFEALQVSHHLHTLLCIVNQQMTTIASLNSQMNSIRENPKSMYRHNDQLEELRNLQDKIQEEKTGWTKRKEQEERDLTDQRHELELLRKKLRAEQIDIGQQRDELHKKMQILSNQGILPSSNVALSPTSIVCSTSDDGAHSTMHGSQGTSSSNLTVDDHDMSGSNSLSTEHRRKDKWRSASISKAPSAHLHGSTNTKVNQSNIKQQLPLKLSSNSSTKSEKSVSTNSLASPPVSSSNGAGSKVTQLLPLKLADKKQSQIITPNHSRTGSSPAVIQQFHSPTSGNPATRTNTYPKLPDRYRLRSTDSQDIRGISNEQHNFAPVCNHSYINTTRTSTTFASSPIVGQQIPRPIYDTPTSINSQGRHKPMNAMNSNKSITNNRSSVQDSKDGEIYF